MAEVSSDKNIIAVTGSTGLLGSYLIKELVSCGQHNIRVLLRSESNPQKLFSFLEHHNIKAQGIEVVQFNMSNPFEWADKLKGVKTLYHCAAVVAIGGIDPQEIITVNRELTAKVVDGCIASGVDLLVHVSSIATLGGSKNKGIMVNENMHLDNFANCSAYTISKFFAENQVKRGAIFGLKTIIVHPAIILGSSSAESSGSASIASQAINKGVFYTQGVIGYVDVVDVARAMVMLSSQDKAVNKSYLLCSENASYKHIIETIRKVAKKPAPICGVGYKMLSAIASMGKLWEKISGTKAVITKDIARNMCTKSYYDGSLISREFNFSYTPLDQTLERITKEYLLK
ncbi:MAG: NAD-dependent epimerase/dehydratase family protein [Rikenellaceae bacterium]